LYIRKHYSTVMEANMKEQGIAAQPAREVSPIPSLENVKPRKFLGQFASTDAQIGFFAWWTCPLE
jgi:hypothetical protein